MSEDRQRLEQMASAIEDLLHMGAIRFGEKEGDKALLSPHFSLVVSNMMESMKLKEDASKDDIMKLMYYSLLIYMSEYLKVPKSLMMAFGNDLEKNRENMESGELVTTYVTILTEVWTQNKK
ncbi:MAG TPA: hypothetical protein VHL10_03980 [Nitrososphaera sp.]|jgi:hypothetical protein|nr:hypothetical protein [Nitrososphaera sp.]